MSEKIAPGVTRESTLPRDPEELVQIEVWKKRRDSARWYIMMGVAAMFASGINVGFAVGGALSCVYGIVGSIYYGRKVTVADDPWDDPDIDHWEAKIIEGEDPEGEMMEVEYKGPF